MLLDPDLVGLRQPRGELIVDVLGCIQPELMDDIAHRYGLDAREPGAGDVPGQNQVAGQPLASWHESSKAHPGVQRDSRLLRKDLDRAERIDHRERAIEGRPHGGRRPVEVPVKITEGRARVRLVPVGEGAPARTAFPHGPHVRRIVLASAVLASYTRQTTGLMARTASISLSSCCSRYKSIAI